MKNKTFLKILLISLILCFFDEQFVSIFTLLLITYIIWTIYRKMKGKTNQINYTNGNATYNQSTKNIQPEPYYEIKPYMTTSEFVFYHKLLKVNENFIIIPQIPLSAIIKKINGKYQNELNRIIDFGIFDKNFNLLLLIELNDSSHNEINRKDRDLKVKKILNDCYIKLLTFYTKYPNEQEYISNRINEALNIQKES